MDFKEWLFLAEQPECAFTSPQTIVLPDEHNEAKRFTFDIIDMQFEKYWKKPEYNAKFKDEEEQTAYWKQIFQAGFQAKLPFGQGYLVYNGFSRHATLRTPHVESLTEAPPDWFRWAQIILGNDVVYWGSKRIYKPAAKLSA